MIKVSLPMCCSTPNQIEVVMSHADALAAVVKVDMLSLLDCFGLEGPSLLLSDSDENHPMGLSEASMIALCDVVFPFSLAENSTMGMPTDLAKRLTLL